MINVRYVRGVRLGDASRYQALINEGRGMQLPQLDVRNLDASMFQQPPNLPPGTTVLMNPAAGQPELGGGSTETAYFVLTDASQGGGDPTTGGENHETFVGPPYEAHRDDGTIEYIAPSTAAQGSWWRTWGPPLALVGGIGLAVFILRRPRRRSR